MLIGGLLTTPIKSAAKKLFKTGTRKTQQIVKESGGTREQAKRDVKSAIRDELKTKLSETPADNPINANKFSAERPAMTRAEYNRLSKRERFLMNLNNNK